MLLFSSSKDSPPSTKKILFHFHKSFNAFSTDIIASKWPPFLSETDMSGGAPEMNFSSDKALRNRVRTLIINQYSTVTFRSVERNFSKFLFWAIKEKNRSKRGNRSFISSSKSGKTSFNTWPGPTFCPAIIITAFGHHSTGSWSRLISPIVNGNLNSRTTLKNLNCGPIEVDYNKKYTLEKRLRNTEIV